MATRFYSDNKIKSFLVNIIVPYEINPRNTVLFLLVYLMHAELS
jgi:hypothetical protein